MSHLEDAMRRLLPRIEAMLRQALKTPHNCLAAHHGMMRYHLGWTDMTFSAESQGGGKRLRPLICLLSCEAVGGDIEKVLPAAAATEILHNFSLVHDDIEDNSLLRRGRPSVWAVWGIAQAVNVGDALMAIAHNTLLQTSEQGVPAERILSAIRAFDETCVALTEGQYLDMSFESRLDVTTEQYTTMIQGKTAALMGLSAQLGPLLTGAESAVTEQFRRFGSALGMAFQISDDVLGIWGDEALMGKSAASDILEQKKSLPVVYALNSRVGERMRAIYGQEAISAEEMPVVLGLLAEVDARRYAEQQAEAAHQEALNALEATGLEPLALTPLRELADWLRSRPS